MPKSYESLNKILKMATIQENNNFKDTFEADESKIVSPNHKNIGKGNLTK